MMHTYTAEDIHSCVAGDTVRFVGDSTVRQIFWAAAKKLDSSRAVEQKGTSSKHTNITFQSGMTRLEFVWDPYLNLSAPRELQVISDDGPMGHEGAIDQCASTLAGSGLWYARYLEGLYDTQYLDIIERLSHLASHLKHDHKQLFSNQTSHEMPHLLIAPVLDPFQPYLNEERALTLTSERIETLNTILWREARNRELTVLWSFLDMTKDLGLAFESSGIHVIEGVAMARADIYLNSICNIKLPQKYPFDVTCCRGTPVRGWTQTMIVLVAIVLPTITLLGTTFSASWVAGRISSGRLQQWSSLAVICMALVYCFIADRSGLFDKVAKEKNCTLFLCFSAVVLIASSAFLSRLVEKTRPLSEKLSASSREDAAVLSRQQTEEWKGWMQVLILFYHYFGMSQVLRVYQLIRLLVASYLFMTGFGHTVYLEKTKDFSFRRLSSTLVRLNLLSCLLPYVMATDYDFYYFPALCSFWVVVIFLTLFAKGPRWLHLNFYFRLSFSVVYVSLLIKYPGLLENIFLVLRRTCRMNLNAREFRFRVSLDMYIVYAGTIVGHIYHQVCNSDSQGWERKYATLMKKSSKASAVIYFGVLLAYSWHLTIFSDKYRSNRYHPYTSPIAVLAFVGLRNAAPALRIRYSPAFAWLGRCSLETFILQYHIWLAADTKGLLRLPLTWYVAAADSFWHNFAQWTQFMVITIFFLWTSWAVSQATGNVTAALVGKAQAQEHHDMEERQSDEIGTKITCKRAVQWLFQKSQDSKLLCILVTFWVLNHVY